MWQSGQTDNPIVYFHEGREQVQPYVALYCLLVEYKTQCNWRRIDLTNNNNSQGSRPEESTSELGGNRYRLCLGVEFAVSDVIRASESAPGSVHWNKSRYTTKWLLRLSCEIFFAIRNWQITQFPMVDLDTLPFCLLRVCCSPSHGRRYNGNVYFENHRPARTCSTFLSFKKSRWDLHSQNGYGLHTDAARLFFGIFCWFIWNCSARGFDYFHN